ncbi:hypothetical protein [Streptomyces violaceusniger]|uniref:hypothetical protein n=1 Tax=Streptomyces violaceusniger TaxID=68280 RepID=UPI001AD8214B|nr:hypothetical protein [Streptomyces violaceusniger]
MPKQAGPAVELELGNPLQLSKTMRARLLAAVRMLVSDPALEGAGDPARLASVVLMAKARVAADYSTEIRAGELGRWLGLKVSRVAHTVLPRLRECGVLGSLATTNAAGWTTGLECWVVPMYRAQHAGDRRHVLALSRVELAVLLKLIEVLFGPGWTHKEKEPTPPGLLADRTGRGAATDRLGLLLMVLSSNSRGWLQLCPGSVDTSRGRPAATAGRLLGCSPAAGAKVLARLQERGVLAVERRETASGLNARSRVRLLPVAQAHGLRIGEASKAVTSVFSDLACAASGDHEASGSPVVPAITGAEGSGQRQEGGVAALAGAAHLHASHAPVVTPVSPVELSGGCSGEGRGGEGRRPERAGAREGELPRPGDGLLRDGGGQSALRAEQPNRPLLSSFTSLGALSGQVPQVAGILSAVIPSPSGFQREALTRLVRGLLADGETDAIIATRLEQRLRPLATGDPNRPYAFRRDALSWALSVGLPYTPGGMTLVPCAHRGCANLTRGRATDRVRCDACELDAMQTEQARRALEAVLAAPLPQPADPPPNAPAPDGDAPAAGRPTHADDLSAGEDPELPGPVREQLLALAAIAPQDLPAARAAAHAAYRPAQEAESAQQHARRVSAATATWCAITTRYADRLASAHDAGSAA